MEPESYPLSIGMEGKLHQIILQKDATILDIRCKMAEMVGLIPERIVVRVCGKEMDDDSLIIRKMGFHLEYIDCYYTPIHTASLQEESEEEGEEPYGWCVYF